MSISSTSESRQIELRELFAAITQAANGSELGIVLHSGALCPEVLYCNEALCRLVGLTYGELRHRPGWSFLSPQEAERMRAAHVERHAGESVPRTVESLAQYKGGTPLPIEVSTTQILLAGEPASLSFITDLRDRKMAEQELRSSEARFRELVDSAPDGIMILRGERLLFANSAAATLLGANADEELAGREVTHFLESIPIVPEFEARSKGPPPIDHSGGEFRSRTGTLVEISATKLDFEGLPAELLFARDVTERRAIQERLQEADRLAAIGMMAAGVAHEINNPLAYVLLNLKFLERELPKLAEDPARLPGLLKHIQDAGHGAQRVRDIVRDLRMCARPDSEAAGPVALEPILENAIAMTEPVREGVVRVIRRFENARCANGTEAKLEQVFINLIANAAQAFHEERSVSPEIQVGLAGAGEWVNITVSDNGPGLSEELQAKVFEPFFTTKRAGVGTGLGLSICRNIIESYGGSISVKSGPGRGACFTVRLPAREAQAALPACSGSLPPLSAPERELRPALMIVDDEVAVAQMLGRMLEQRFEVTLCGSGADALETLAAGGQFDAILCDLMMPQMTGMELYATLQTEHPRVGERMIFMTGGALNPGVSRFLNEVDRPRLEKPFELGELTRLLAQEANASRLDKPINDRPGATSSAPDEGAR